MPAFDRRTHRKQLAEFWQSTRSTQLSFYFYQCPGFSRSLVCSDRRSAQTSLVLQKEKILVLVGRGHRQNSETVPRRVLVWRAVAKPRERLDSAMRAGEDGREAGWSQTVMHWSREDTHWCHVRCDGFSQRNSSVVPSLPPVASEEVYWGTWNKKCTERDAEHNVSRFRAWESLLWILK